MAALLWAAHGELPWEPHPEGLSQELRDWIEQGLGGTDLLPVCQKTLTATDVSPHHRRLLIPMNTMVSLAFLKEEERATVELPSTKGVERGVPVQVISHPSLHRRTLSLRKWVMNKGGGKATEMYVLTTSGWAGVVEDNNLKAGEVIQIWSYRVEGQLHMLVPPSERKQSHRKMATNMLEVTGHGRETVNSV